MSAQFDLKISNRIDHLRAISALLVFVFHYQHFVNSSYFSPLDSYNPFRILIYHGYIGVSLFFCLSGFLFATVYAGHTHIKIANFYIKRLLRVFPAFSFVVFVFVILNNEPIKNVFKIIAYLFHYKVEVYPYDLSHLWSVNRELQCYLAFPLLWMICNKFGRSKLIIGYSILFAITMFFGISENTKQLTNFYSTYCLRFEEFVLGLIAGLFFKKKLIPQRYLYAALVLFSVLIVLYQRSIWENPLDYSIYGVAWLLAGGFFCTGLIILYLLSDVCLPNIIDKSLVYMGEISYSFYLFHFLLINFALSNQWITADRHMGQFVLVFLGCFIIAAMSFHLIEKPGLNLKRHIKST